MKCPYCEYENGWSAEKMETIQGYEGEFYTLSNSVKMERESFGYGKSEKRVYGCPDCGKIFMDF